MPAKRSTRFTVKHFAKQMTRHFAMKNFGMKHFGMKHFGMKHFTVKRPMAIGIIFVCIVGTAMLIVARSSEPTSAASIVPEQATVAIAPIEQTPGAKAPKPKAAKPAAAAAPAADEVVGRVSEGAVRRVRRRRSARDWQPGRAP